MYRIIESGEEVVNRILPDTSIVMAFRYKGSVNYVGNNTLKKLPLAVVSGLRKSSRLIQYGSRTGNILVIFKSGLASAFIREPLHDLFEESIDLDAIDGYKVSTLHEQLASAQNHTSRIGLIEEFLLSRLKNHKPDRLTLNAIDQIRFSNGMLRIKELANNMCLSQDAFEKRFRKVAGVSPKQYSSIVRMRSLLSTNFKDRSLSEIAHNAGYFDQSHFNKEFKLFTGQTPTDFLRSPAAFW